MTANPTFNFNGSVNSHMRSTNVSSLQSQINQLVNKAVIINDIRDGIISKTDLSEYDSIKKIKLLCEKLGYKFEYNYTSDSSIDIYINDFACQCKTSSCVYGNLYQFHLRKKIDGIEVPYDLTDKIDYFIFQIIDPNNKSKYADDFLILPISYLVHHGYIKTAEDTGKCLIRIPSPDFHEYHWLVNQWNNFQYIKHGELAFNHDPLYDFSKRYECIIKNYRKGQANNQQIQIGCGEIKDTTDYIVVIFNDGIKRVYSDYVFLLSRLKLNNIIYLFDENKQGSFTIAFPDCQYPHWSNSHWIKVSDISSLMDE